MSLQHTLKRRVVNSTCLLPRGQGFLSSPSRAVLHAAPIFNSRWDGERIHRTTGFDDLSCKAFSTSRCLFKKGAKAARDEKKASSKDQASDDPYDFTTLEGDIAAAIERLKNDLSKLRAGGRFNPEVLENLRVQPDKKLGQTVKLNDLAQVVPKGRTVQILVGEQEHIKPISSAVQGSSLSLTPQPDPTGSNPLMLVVNIPPPTTESRKAAVNDAAKAGERAGTAVRDARAKQHKKLRAMQLEKSVRPDDLKKAGTQMEKLVEKGTADVKRVVDSAKKVLESG